MNNINPWGDVVLPSRPEYRLSGMLLTFFLALLNAGVYIWQVNYASPLTDQIYNMLLAGGSVYRLSLTGDWWRYITSILLHSDPFHLGVNLIALLVFGINCEALTGKMRMLFIYLFTGISASFASALWQAAQNDMSPLSGIPVTVGVGASGAIMGLAGATVMYLIRARKDPSVSVADSLRYKNLLITMIVLIVLSVLSAVPDDEEPVTDNVAHFSGLICGAVLGWLYSAASGVRNRKMDRRSWLISAAATGLLILLLFTCSSSREQQLLFERETILEDIAAQADALPSGQKNN